MGRHFLNRKCRMTQLWQQILPISGKGEDIMKYRKWMTVGAALAFLFTAQPAYAAPVIVAGSGSLAVESTQTVGEQQASEAVTQAPGAGQTETTAAVSQSPTIVSGQGQSAPGSTGSENSAPVSAGEVTGIPEGPGGIKSESVTPVTPEELAAQEAAQAAAQQSTGQSQTTDGIDPSKPMVALTSMMARSPRSATGSWTVWRSMAARQRSLWWVSVSALIKQKCSAWWQKVMRWLTIP